MYAAKEAGRGRFELVHYDMARELGELLGLEHELRLGLQRGEFTVHYQPEVDLENGAIVGVEALVRWNSPRRGLVRRPPGCGPPGGMSRPRGDGDHARQRGAGGARARGELQQLHEEGVRIAVDDFCTRPLPADDVRAVLANGFGDLVAASGAAA